MSSPALVLGGVGVGFEAHVVSKGLKLLDGFGFGFGGVVSGVAVRAGVLVESAVDEHAPGADEHLVFERNNGGLPGGGLAARLLRGGPGSSAPSDAAEAGAEVGVGAPRCRQGGHPKGGFEVMVAGQGLGGFDPTGLFTAAGCDPRP